MAMWFDSSLEPLPKTKPKKALWLPEGARHPGWAVVPAGFAIGNSGSSHLVSELQVQDYGPGDVEDLEMNVGGLAVIM